MSGYAIYGVKYTKGRMHLIEGIKVLGIALKFTGATKLKQIFEEQYSVQEDKFSIWEIYVSDEVEVY